MPRTLVVLPILLVLLGVPGAAQDAGDLFHRAIRQDDLAALRTLVATHGANAADAREQTPLMLAAAFGSLDAMNILIASGAEVKAISQAGVTALHWCAGDARKVGLLLNHGADVHVVSQHGRTPLLVAAGTSGSIDAVRLLLQKGASVNVADSAGVTPLIAAASVDETAVAKLLLESGADARAQAPAIGQAATALMGAAHNGNVELTRLLLARRADPNSVSAPFGARVKNGPVLFGHVTALHLATLGGSADVVKLLLDAGAAVDVVDARGMTPLMFAVSTDRPDARIIRMLVVKGADATIRSKVDESALDWARKFNHPAVLAELKLQPPKGGAAAAELAVSHSQPASPREAVERSLPVLQRSAASVVADGGCIACHATPMAAMAVDLARARGWRVDDGAAAASIKMAQTFLAADQPLLQGREGGGSPDTQVYIGMMAAAAHQPPSLGTDVLVHYLVAKQRGEGRWRGVGGTRAPMQDGDFSRTAMSIRALATYGMPGRKAEIVERIERAAGWLARQAPLTTEDRVMQLLGLKWADAHQGIRDVRTRALVSEQKGDGGWAQTPYSASDAYATGQVLYTLRELGVSPSDAAFRRGADFLLRTQKADGSWYVKSRAMKIQPYFESHFPYGHDQWISAAATAWAAMGLSLTAQEPPAKTPFTPTSHGVTETRR